jgi:glycosyltransferase involved in cell wall biosynthesis
MRIFVCIESYFPGTLGGGPVRALVNLIDHLHAEHEFFIFTRNHDYLQAVPYSGIEPNVWQTQPKASVYYSDSQNPVVALSDQIKCVQPDWIYLNGALPPFTRDLLRLRRKDQTIQKIPTLLAPHGNLSPYALAHRRFRKQAWLVYAKVSGFYNDLIWHAASERETEQIHAVFGTHARIREVPMAPRRKAPSDNVPLASDCNSDALGKKTPLLDEEGWTAQRVGVVPDSTTNKQPTNSNSTLRLVYFGRLSPEKNLEFAFRLLAKFAAKHPDQQVLYDLIGAGEARYEAKLRRLSGKLPSAIQVNFIGQLSPEDLQARLNKSSALKTQVVTLHSSLSTPHSSRYHAMLMPSLTENFSYTVIESLLVGIPVLISDQTPWRQLQEAGVGWDLALNDIEAWLQGLLSLLSASDDVRSQQSSVTRDYALKSVRGFDAKRCQLFELPKASGE